MKWNEFIKDYAWVVDSFLAPCECECEYIIQRATDLGIQDKAAAGDVRHRNSTTAAFDDLEMAQRNF